jgi:hypothetical protein
LFDGNQRSRGDRVPRMLRQPRRPAKKFHGATK